MTLLSLKIRRKAKTSSPMTATLAQGGLGGITSGPSGKAPASGSVYESIRMMTTTTTMMTLMTMARGQVRIYSELSVLTFLDIFQRFLTYS